MNLKILLPFRPFATVTDVLSIVAETQTGSFGLLPHRLDCVASLTPGIFSYTTQSGAVFLAADEGVLVKRGMDVIVSVRHCICGSALALLHEAVEREFLDMNTQDRAIRAAVTRMEASFVGRLAEFQHER